METTNKIFMLYPIDPYSGVAINHSSLYIYRKYANVRWYVQEEEDRYCIQFACKEIDRDEAEILFELDGVYCGKELEDELNQKYELA